MPVDYSLPLQSQPFDVGKVAQNANALMALQQARQQVEAQNALRQVFADPNNLDPATGMPTGAALTKIMAIDPNTGMKLRQNMLTQQEQQLQMEGTKTTNYGKKLDLAHEKTDAALTAYEDAVKRGVPEEQARDQAQKIYSDGYDDLSKSGLFSESEIKRMNPQFDPTRARSNAMTYKEWKAQQDKEAKEGREAKHQSFEEGIQTKELGLAGAREGREAARFKEEQAGIPLTEPAMEEAARDYITTGKLPTGASRQNIADIAGKAAELRKTGIAAPKDYGQPVGVTVTKPDGTKETTTAVYDKDNARWLSADGRQPIAGKVEMSKEARADTKSAGQFTDQMGALMAALAEQGVSLPAGFRSKEQQAKLYQSLLDRHPGMSVEDIAQGIKTGAIEFSAQKKETQVAAGIVGRVEVAQNELAEFVPLAREASAKVPRINFMPITKLLQTADASISDPNLKQLKIYVNELLNSYDVLAARGGTDKDKRAETRALLTSADGPEAFESGLAAFEKIAAAAHRAAIKATKVQELPDVAGRDKGEKPAAGEGASPPISMLSEGVDKTFSNGQTWTLKNGVPTLVQAGSTKVP